MTTITGSTYRISFLTSRLIRLEYQAQGLFEDQPTTFARCRNFPDVPVVQRQSVHGLELDTEFLHVVYDEKPFSPHGLSVAVKGSVTHYRSVWRYGDAIQTLGGTARTLDGVDGKTEVEPGVISVFGFSVLDDSTSMLLTEDGCFIPRNHPETDLYFFGYGHDYQACMRDYYLLSGSVPMLPRYALGNWWSRYHEYTEESYLRLLDHFDQAGIPLSVAVIDMDWHITENAYTSGWTGYTWNRAFFPDPERFLKELHQRGLQATLNLHPADGVAPHEEAYSAFCKAMGQDEQQKLSIDFDAADEQFWDAYFRLLHHPLEKQGVDFWWIDWQQGGVSALEGLDPLWVLNEKHYRDIQRNGKRGLILSRYAGPGSHRCPVGFSGDTITTWASLQYQPQFTAMASNIGYPWWSHDIGGHMRGIRSDELSVRWLQYGVFSPILRLHSSKSDFMSKEPWAYGKEAERIMTAWLRFRHRLIPYLYTAMEGTHRLGEALVQPVYYRWPDQREAYTVPNQYLFGPSLLVCPVTQPLHPDLLMAETTAWLPEGIWYDFSTGRQYTGGRMLSVWRGLEEYAVFASAGAIIPLADSLRADENPEEMTLRIFGGADGSYDLYEDDGISLESKAARTHMHFDWENGTLTIQTEGEKSLLPAQRVFHVELFGVASTKVRKELLEIPAAYDAEQNILRFSFVQSMATPCVTIQFEALRATRNDWLKWAKDILQKAQTANDEKEMIWGLLRSKGNTPAAYGTLQTLCSSPALISSLAEAMFAQEAEGGGA